MPKSNHSLVAPSPHEAVVVEIATVLGETSGKPLSQIRQLVELWGIEAAQRVCQEALQIETDGGMMLPDNSRRRTLGGIFFLLARQQVPDEVHAAVFPNYKRYAPGEEPSTREALPVLVWAERRAVINPLLQDQGEASTVKVSLVGRPGRVERRKDVVVTTMAHVHRAPTLPKGLPTPPEEPTVYTIYIATKQWRRVEEAVEQADDALIVEGLAAFDRELNTIAVYATNVKSMQQELHRRQQQRENAGTGDSEGMVAVHAGPPGVPSEIVHKYRELQASVGLFRQKIAALEARPAGQRFGLEMTQKLLKNAEDEMTGLERKYPALAG